MQDIGTICEQLPSLTALNLSHNLMADVVVGLPRLGRIRTLVLNCTGVKWTQVEELEHLLPVIEELHLMGNGISEIKVLVYCTLILHEVFHWIRSYDYIKGCLSIEIWTDTWSLPGSNKIK